MRRERRFGRDRRSDGLSLRAAPALEVPRSKKRTSSSLANGACKAAGADHVRPVSAAMSALGFRWFPSRGFHPAAFLASGGTRDSGPRRSRLQEEHPGGFVLELFAAASTASATRSNQLQWILGE
ncbi:hypothetical protein IscW_ISCW006030 [Ixodes scapularis]|uniref:Uncharacterized protein n=1 Tax=Ixodes scapularis TaxID=6945 RepID=B7PME3_IXOSC|nr:hypothetical protein IscW_ISCW006030 [Ixodes scapularis]|eukprot:XP_002434941.1 hypothetical protein IscW_ISCW006030 [Ixodes scapularis]